MSRFAKTWTNSTRWGTRSVRCQRRTRARFRSATSQMISTRVRSRLRVSSSITSQRCSRTLWLSWTKKSWQQQWQNYPLWCKNTTRRWICRKGSVIASKPKTSFRRLCSTTRSLCLHRQNLKKRLPQPLVKRSRRKVLSQRRTSNKWVDCRVGKTSTTSWWKIRFSFAKHLMLKTWKWWTEMMISRSSSKLRHSWRRRMKRNSKRK